MELWFGVGLVVVALAVYGGLSFQRLEEPVYEVVERDEAAGIELRDYAAITVAETRVPGDRLHAVRRGFRPLAAYIFGRNGAGERLAMTAPVTQTLLGGQTWAVRFVMPAERAAALPTPRDRAVRLRLLPARRCAVHRFSGVGSTDRLHAAETRVRGWLAERGLPADGAAAYAYYDDPITLPFLRRNEVIVDLDASAGEGTRRG